MPSGILDADNRFPNLRGGGDVEQRFGEVEDYLFLLLENLRYVLRNLGAENFNQTELFQIGENFSENVSGPIYKRLEDDEGNIAEIIARADLIATRMTNAEGDISALEQTATSITSRVSDAEGNISVLQQTATGITSRVSSIEEDNGRIHTSISTLEQTAASITSRVASVETDNLNIHTSISSIEQTAASITTRVSSAEGRITGLDGSVTTLSSQVSELEQTATSITARVSNSEGEISTLKQTATSITSRVSTAEGNISTLTQTANSLTSRVSTAEGNISTVTQTANKISWLVASGTSSSNFTLTDRTITLVANKIDLSGYVTFSSLSTSGQTAINGANITTGTISADRIDADSLKVTKIWAEKTLTSPAISFSGDTMEIGHSGSSYSMSNISILASSTIKLGQRSSTGRQITIDGTEIKFGSSSFTLGSNSYPLNTLYLANLYASTGGATTWKIGNGASTIGFFGSSGSARQRVSDSATVAQLITALKAYGLIS